MKPNKGTNKNKEENFIKVFCRKIFPDVSINITNPGWLHGQTTTALINEEVDVINDIMEGWVLGTANRHYVI